MNNNVVTSYVVQFSILTNEHRLEDTIIVRLLKINEKYDKPHYCKKL